jgi:hypothetical protein
MSLRRARWFSLAWRAIAALIGAVLAGAAYFYISFVAYFVWYEFVVFVLRHDSDRGRAAFGAAAGGVAAGLVANGTAALVLHGRVRAAGRWATTLFMAWSVVSAGIASALANPGILLGPPAGAAATAVFLLAALVIAARPRESAPPSPPGHQHA